MSGDKLEELKRILALTLIHPSRVRLGTTDVQFEEMEIRHLLARVRAKESLGFALQEDALCLILHLWSLLVNSPELVAEIERLRTVLEDLNLKTCYASQECLADPEGMLLLLGSTIRAALGRPDPIDSFPHYGNDSHPEGYEGACGCRSCIGAAN